ncbi:thioesterase family protein [Pseudonocardia sp. C8]|nr:thioesterase family protein [Pseudonocardia sp. C8]MBC3191875.1 thioesterase family protein [Pseudonocardia sp. C8]
MVRPSFTELTAIRPAGEGRWRADLDPRWTIGGRPNGGYLLAVAGRAAVAASDRAHTLAASAQYLRPPEPGPVELRTEVLRHGRTATHVRVQLSQDGTACVESLLVTGRLEAPGTPAAWTAPDAPVPPPASPDGIRVPPVTPDGVPVPIMDQVAVDLDAGTAGFATGTPSGRGEIAGRLTLPGAEPFDDCALLYAVDALPPASLTVAATGWVPTVSMTVYVRALPAPGPVHVRCSSSLIDGGRVDEACWIHDSSGRLVAHGSQLAGIRYP